MSNKKWVVAVVGASGAVGTAVVEILAERAFPIERLVALGSERSAGEPVAFGNRQVTVELLDGFDFSGVDIAFFCAGSSVSETHVPRAVAAGAMVIDNSSLFRGDADVPLVVPEVNPDALALHSRRRIVANPNCSTIQLVMALAPLHQAVGISRVNVATYQSVSGAGRDGMDELGRQTAALLNFQPAQSRVFDARIAFNVIPHIDAFDDNGFTGEEMKVMRETRRILGDDTIGINVTAVRVPVFYGHAEAVHLETREPITAAQARELLKKAPGVVVMDEQRSGGYPTPAEHAGTDEVFVGRIRQDPSHPCGLNMWVVADNLRKGAALNAVQIAEHLVEAHW